MSICHYFLKEGVICSAPHTGHPAFLTVMDVRLLSSSSVISPHWQQHVLQYNVLYVLKSRAIYHSSEYIVLICTNMTWTLL